MMEERSYHLFLSCPTFAQFGIICANGLVFQGLILCVCRITFLQFGQSRGNYRRLWASLILIWLACIWVLWKERNNMIFNNKDALMDEIVDKVKLHSFWWLKVKHVIFAFSYRHIILFFQALFLVD